MKTGKLTTQLESTQESLTTAMLLRHAIVSSISNVEIAPGC